MKDKLGHYYFPTLQIREERMYVRDNAGVIEFRLWNENKPEIWEKHGWRPYEAVKTAAELYQNENDDPLKLYDISIAKALLSKR